MRGIDFAVDLACLSCLDLSSFKKDVSFCIDPHVACKIVLFCLIYRRRRGEKRREEMRKENRDQKQSLPTFYLLALEIP